jgi:hypothetical protein
MSDTWQCPGCGYGITDGQHRCAKQSLPCFRCGKHTISEFVLVPGAGKLTDEQIENWRRLLLPMCGVAVLFCSAEEIQALREKVQARFDGLGDD